MNIKAVAADIKTFQRLSREASGLGGGGAAAAAGMEVTADTPREEKQRQYGLKGPAHPAEVGMLRGRVAGRNGQNFCCWQAFCVRLVACAHIRMRRLQLACMPLVLAVCLQLHDRPSNNGPCAQP